MKLGAGSPTAGMESSLVAPQLPNTGRGLSSGGQEELPEPTRFPPGGQEPARLCNAWKAAGLSSFSLRTAGPGFLEPTMLGAESWLPSHSGSSSVRKGHASFCCCPPVAFSPRMPSRRDSCSAASRFGGGGEAWNRVTQGSDEKVAAGQPLRISSGHRTRGSDRELAGHHRWIASKVER